MRVFLAIWFIIAVLCGWDVFFAPQEFILGQPAVTLAQIIGDYMNSAGRKNFLYDVEFPVVAITFFAIFFFALMDAGDIRVWEKSYNKLLKKNKRLNKTVGLLTQQLTNLPKVRPHDPNSASAPRPLRMGEVSGEPIADSGHLETH